MASDLSKEKLQLIEWILKQEKASCLKSISDLIVRLENQSADSSKIVGYRSKGLRVTKAELIKSISESLAQIEENKLVDLDAVERDSDQW
jgi:hypothetical protein